MYSAIDIAKWFIENQYDSPRTDAIETLKLTVEIYGSSTASELSEMSHQFEFWKKYLHNLIGTHGYKSKKKSLVPNSELKNEIDSIKDVLYANEILKKVNLNGS